jgi:hypothetical protein
MQKNKKMVTESSRDQKRTLRIAESPKKVTKLKLGSLLEANKQKEMDQINEVIREKLEDYPNTASRVRQAISRTKGSIPTKPSTTMTSHTGRSTAKRQAVTNREASISNGPTTSQPSMKSTIRRNDLLILQVQT